MDPAIERLRSRAPANDLDYGFVMDCLKEYKSPRSKMTKLLKSGALIRVKKGLYLFGPLFQRGPYSREVLANKMYGPSYVSLEWALQYYGMIPERVHEVTSVTSKRKKTFQTPIGRFSYSHMHPEGYPTGVTLIQISNTQKALIATREKAVTDLLMIRRGKITSQSELKEILFEDFRFEEHEILKLNLNKIKTIYDAYPHSAVKHLIHYIKEENLNE